MTGPGTILPYQPRVVVKFIDGIGLPYDSSATDTIRHRVDPPGTLAAEFPDLVFEPYFDSQSPGAIRALIEKARDKDSTYTPADFFAFFAVPVPDGADPEQLRDALSRLPSVSFAYVESPPGELPAVYPGDDPLSAQQGYLDAAPVGIDARYAWTTRGGDGAGQALVDVEWGWTLKHEDLKPHNIAVFSGVSLKAFYHGTAILGIIAAVDNNKGVVGIVPAIRSVRCASEYRADGTHKRVAPILDAAGVMAPGDVLLLETQVADYFGYKNLPVEVEPGVFEAVRLATARGIVVVAAAGNGGRNLDQVKIPKRGYVLNRQRAVFEDSGAIIVGGAKSVDRARTSGSNFGSRVDCFAWGNNVTTTFTNPSGTSLNGYTNAANGTSAAAAIVAGAAAAAQGAAELQLGQRFDPKALRALLSDPANTSSKTPAVDRIGVMPNLKYIIDSLT
jgi:hypothetical protein